MFKFLENLVNFGREGFAKVEQSTIKELLPLILQHVIPGLAAAKMDTLKEVLTLADDLIMAVVALLPQVKLLSGKVQEVLHSVKSGPPAVPAANRPYGMPIDVTPITGTVAA